MRLEVGAVRCEVRAELLLHRDHPEGWCLQALEMLRAGCSAGSIPMYNS